jgi:beta-glucanase (GH16 family)
MEGGQRGSYGSIAPMAAYGLGKLDDWHTYGVLITRQRYQRFIDGVLVFDQPNRVNTPMYMLINVAVGGSVIGGTPPEDAPFVADMMLDYVAVWQWPAK